MKKRAMFLAFSAMFILGACSKGNTPKGDATSGEENSAVSMAAESSGTAISDSSLESSTENTEEKETSQSESTAEASSYSGFKKAYIDLLNEEARKNAPNLTEDNSRSINGYRIYDIDKDGTPELWVEYGSCEADFHASLYKYDGEEAKLISEEIPMGHTSVLAIPDENGFLLHWSHMGGEQFTKQTLENDELVSELLYEGSTIDEDSQTGEQNATFKSPQEIHPGSYGLSSFSYDNTYPIEIYEAISSDPVTGDTKNYTYPDNNPDFFTDIIDNDTNVNAVALDKYMKTPGKVTFGKLLSDGTIYEYAKAPMEVKDITYADLNGDSVYECIFYITDSEGSRHRAIMSAQEDEVYVYLGYYPYEDSITEDGFFVINPEYSSDDDSLFRILYDKEKCFTYYVSPKCRK